MKRILTTRLTVAFLFFGVLSPILSQTVPALDSSVYLSFFREAASHVVQRPPKGEPSTLNGEPTDLVPQSIQDAMGITDGEATAVVHAAIGCDDEINALDASAHALVFESRLLAVNGEKPPEALAERLREIEARRVGIIMNHVEQLKAELAAARFKVLEDYIRLRQNDGVFFPSANPKKRL